MAPSAQDTISRYLNDRRERCQNAANCCVAGDCTVGIRRIRGRLAEGHSLAAVCRRELAMVLDKSQQTSDWTRRPLTDAQIAYAALDVEVLVQLYELFIRIQPELPLGPPGRA